MGKAPIGRCGSGIGKRPLEAIPEPQRVGRALPAEQSPREHASSVTGIVPERPPGVHESSMSAMRALRRSAELQLGMGGAINGNRAFAKLELGAPGCPNRKSPIEALPFKHTARQQAAGPRSLVPGPHPQPTRSRKPVYRRTFARIPSNSSKS
jgi:hypothetical protein